MFSLLVSSRCVRGPVSLNENEAGRVVLLLQDVEPGNAGFLNALAGVGKCGLLERIDQVRFYPNVYVDNKHGAAKASTCLQIELRKSTALGWPVKASFDERLEISTVAGFFHLLDWYEPQGC